MSRRHVRFVAALLGVCGLVSITHAQVTGTITNSVPQPLEFCLPLSGTSSGTVNTSVLIPETAGGDVDVLFAIDTTGSMGSFLSTLRTVFGTVASNVTAANPGVNFNFAVAEYKDALDGLQTPSATNRGWRLTNPFSPSVPATQAAINGLIAIGGNDWPEANFNLLTDAGNDWTNPASFNGRNSAQKIVINGGDAVSHDGTETSSDGGPGFYSSLNQTVASLVGRGATYFGVTNDTAGGTFGLNASSTSWLGTDPRRQAATLASATGGTNFFGVGFADTAAIQAAIEGAITMGTITVGNVSLTIDGDLGDWKVHVINSPRIGPFDADDSPLLTAFSLDIVAPGYIDDRNVTVTLRADGAPLDQINLHLKSIPTPGGLALLGMGGLLCVRRRKHRA